MDNDEGHEERIEALSFEREKLALEREKLALERERVEADTARLEELERAALSAHGKSFTVEPVVAAVGAAVVFAVGLVLGGAIGFDIGKSKVPPPRKVMLSRAFISAMRSASGVRLVPFDQDEAAAPWMPAARTDYPENLVIVR
jgi:hypothetical protein